MYQYRSVQIQGNIQKRKEKENKKAIKNDSRNSHIFQSLCHPTLFRHTPSPLTSYSLNHSGITETANWRPYLHLLL